MTPPMPSFLEDRGLQLLMFGGKGGVGKTTCAAASALHMSALSPERSLLLVSTDPAHSIRDSLAGWDPPSNLRVQEIDARECLKRFHAKNSLALERIASAGTFLDDEDTHKLVNLSLPGLDELMAFLEISDWVIERAYDCIIVDTAPSGHALRLLAMPDLIRRWLAVMDALLAKRRYMKRAFTGHASNDSLDAFVAEWAVSMSRMEKLLRDPARCRFVPVTIADPLAVRETEILVRQLRHRHMPVSELVVNQLHRTGRCPSCSRAHQVERRGIESLRIMAVLSSNRFWGIELLPNEVRGQSALRSFWSHAAPLSWEPEICATAPVLEKTVEGASAQPSEEIQFILVSGKGGVGKTTLACATALRLARDFPWKRVLLFSTDSAHSLSACLGTRIGPHPATLSENLDAVEIDAAAEFRALRDRYAKDVDDLLQAFSPGFDLTFDRVVLEKMVDLAPPGLDEVMALVRIVDFLARDRYDLFIMDAASTGHLIRLLELPELIDEWLKTFFGLLLKYQHVLRMPRFSDQLIDLSKNLKRLRRLLSDPSRAALYAVAIPTQMAWEETKDLMEACDRMGIATPALFLNMMTPPGGCALCARLRTRELAVGEQFRRAFPGKLQTQVYRQGDIAGIERLAELGQSLYEEQGVLAHA
jgi:arsenite/tail-anchored protein-transporting ATPase